MKDQTTKLNRSAKLALNGSVLLQKRLQVAQDGFTERARAVYEAQQKQMLTPPTNPLALWESAVAYGVDFAQRSAVGLEITLLPDVIILQPYLCRSRLLRWASTGTAARLTYQMYIEFRLY